MRRIEIDNALGHPTSKLYAVWDDYDGAIDSVAPIGFGDTKHEAAIDLIENTDELI